MILAKLDLMKIQIINGPNLNLLGVREKSIYVDAAVFETYLEKLRERYPDIEIAYYQSNVEGEIINKIHEVGFSFDGIVLNAGAYTHTSIAIADAIAAIKAPVIEVHISQRLQSVRNSGIIPCLLANCRGVIAGFGMNSYRLAVESLLAD